MQTSRGDKKRTLWDCRSKTFTSSLVTLAKFTKTNYSRVTLAKLYKKFCSISGRVVLRTCFTIVFVLKTTSNIPAKNVVQIKILNKFFWFHKSAPHHVCWCNMMTKKHELNHRFVKWRYKNTNRTCVRINGI